MDRSQREELGTEEMARVLKDLYLGRPLHEGATEEERLFRERAAANWARAKAAGFIYPEIPV